MGNKISKKKTKININTSHHPRKVKTFWNFGRGDKLKAGQKQDQQGKLSVHYTASQHYQENVFIEGNRPKHLEDLHTEAQEGLKILQQEVQDDGMDFQDDHSISTATTQQENDCLEEDGQLSFDSNADQSIMSASTVSALSTRPVLTRQGSTFKPLNSLKRLDRTKKRSRRTTIVGIPQHVQKELCMGKEALLKQLTTAEDDGALIIPTIDGDVSVTSHEGVRVHLQDIEAFHVSRDEQLLKQQIHALYKDDLFLPSKSGPLYFMQRPKSLAVPELTTTSTFLQEPKGPVMSISPQATYLSTIIPNAILPSSIDVIEIDRSLHRHSVCTVNKSSFLSASPGSSCSEEGTHGAPSNTSKRGSSQSSETIVSNPSTISFKGSETPANSVNKMMDVADLNEERLSLKSSASWSSSTSKTAMQRPEPRKLSNTAVTTGNSQLCSRNLSIIKAKLPPVPPPRKSGQNIVQRQSISANASDTYLGFNGGQKDEGLDDKVETSIYNENTSTSSPVSVFSDDALSLATSPYSPVQKSTYAQIKPSDSAPEHIFERTVSPSSGYSSQSGTPTHSSKDICPTSPRRIKAKPPKPERISVRISPVDSSLVSLSSTSSERVSHCMQTTAPPPIGVSLTVTTKSVASPTSIATTIRELIDIPPPPKVKAPCPPPPETWAHNKRITELLFGPPSNAQRPFELEKPCENDLFKTKNQKTDNSKERQALAEHHLEEVVPTVVKEQDQPQQLEQKSTPMSITLARNNNQKPQSPTKQLESKFSHDVLSENKHFTPKAEGININDQYLINHCSYVDITDRNNTQMVTIEGSETIELSSSFSQPSDHHPLSSQKEEQQSTTELSILEYSWPPPPPPMDESLVFEGQDEIDFPLPPPPVMQESFLENPDNCNKSSHGQNETSEECTDALDIVSNLEENRNPQIIMSTTLENISPKMSGISEDKLHQSEVKSKSTEDVSQASVIYKTSTLQNTELQILHEDISTEPQHDLSNPLTTTANDFSNQIMNESAETFPDVSPTSVLSADDQSTSNFRRKPNSTIKDNKAEALSYKSAPNLKEDANIPLVTPSLLQMVRLRSLNVEDQKGSEPPQDKDCTSNMVTPQKPVRKSIQLSIKSSTVSAPSMCLQQAIRMKTAAMSSRGLSARPNLCLSTLTPNNNHDSHTPITSHKTPDDGDLHKSPASTASFIFSKSTNKVVIETPTSPEAQAGLKQSLAAELMQISDQTKSAVTNGRKKSVKIPPPIAKKPVCATILSGKDGTVTALKMENSSSKHENGRANQQTRILQPAGQQAQSTGNQMLAGRTETPRTFEVS